MTWKGVAWFIPRLVIIALHVILTILVAITTALMVAALIVRVNLRDRAR